MHIAVFGATGGTGRHFLEQALAQGHSVSALVRDPAKLDISHPQLQLVTGNVLEPTAVARTLEGSTAVVCSLGTTSNNPGDVVSTGTKNIIHHLQQHGPQRLLVVTSLGVGDSADQVPFVFKLLMKSVLKKVMADKEVQEAAVRASGLEWTIVRPGGLTDGPATGQYTVGTGREIKAGQVRRADVAQFLMQELTAAQYLRQAVAIT